jgi:probable F420-dependent oxidoreductase
MEFGLQLGNLEWQRLRDVAQMAEEVGFHALMSPDHLVYEGPERQFDPRHFAYDPMVVAALLAESTKRVQIGHLVLCNLFRHPAVTAQSLASLDTLSGGRVFAGLGTGWTEREFKMTGIAFPDIKTRLRMLDEALTCMRSLWTRETTTFAGEFYRLQDAILWPKPARQPHLPILLGGGGRGLLRVAAKHADVINIISDAGRPGYISMQEISKLTDESFRAKIRFVREEASRHGRDPKAIRISNVMFATIVTDSPEATRAMAAAMAPAFNSTPQTITRSPMALIGTPEECVAELRRRRQEWDVSQFVFSSADEATVRRLGAEVLPHV